LANEISLILDTQLPLPRFARGKVRDIYDLGKHLLIVATDRVSAFDVVLPGGIPGKGPILNQLSLFWFERTRHLLPNHVVAGVSDLASITPYIPVHVATTCLPCTAGRSMIVNKVKTLPVECIVRGYLTGTAFAEYQEHGTIGGIRVPSGLRESERLPEPLFTPTTKAETGHDEPLTMNEVERMLGSSLAAQVRDSSLAIYAYASEYASSRDIIIADTKLEFGLGSDGLLLIDELLTPDSSRFWDRDIYAVGHPQQGFDKQLVRNWLVESGWDKEPPAPSLGAEIITATANRYLEIFLRLTGGTPTSNFS